MGREGEEEKPGTDIVSSKPEELLGKTAMKVKKLKGKKLKKNKKKNMKWRWRRKVEI